MERNLNCKIFHEEVSEVWEICKDYSLLVLSEKSGVALEILSSIAVLWCRSHGYGFVHYEFEDAARQVPMSNCSKGPSGVEMRFGWEVAAMSLSDVCALEMFKQFKHVEAMKPSEIQQNPLTYPYN